MVPAAFDQNAGTALPIQQGVAHAARQSTPLPQRRSSDSPDGFGYAVVNKVGVIAVAVALGPMLLIAPLGLAVVGASSARAACAGQNATTVNTAVVAKQVESILTGKSKESVSVPGLDKPKEQIQNAKTIQVTGVEMQIPARGQVVALATALQESKLRNLSYGDRDSLGLFQQRPSQGWGTAEEVRDPVYASTKFYEGLLQVSGWESMTVAQAAQAVQKSAFPDAYAKWEPLANALQEAIARQLSQGGESESDDGTSTEPATPGRGCGAESGPITPGSVPAGYEIPADVPASVRKAIRWGLGQLGTPYQWGGDCSDPHGPDPMGRCDCSSLMQASYKAGGVSLSRTTYTQVKEGKPVGVDDIRPGDLLFTRGTAAAPEHVGIAIGEGLVLQAPATGDVVKISALADWEPDILAVRRVV